MQQNGEGVAVGGVEETELYGGALTKASEVAKGEEQEPIEPLELLLTHSELFEEIDGPCPVAEDYNSVEHGLASDAIKVTAQLDKQLGMVVTTDNGFSMSRGAASVYKTMVMRSAMLGHQARERAEENASCWRSVAICTSLAFVVVLGLYWLGWTATRQE